MNFPQMKLTQAGIDAILDVVYGSSALTFTAVRFGDGNPPSDIRSLTNLVHTVTPTGIASCTVADHMATIKTVFDNASIDTGFYLREIGVFASLNDGPEFLYSYTNAGTAAGWLKPYAADDLVSLVLDIVVAVGDAEKIDAVISGAVGYVTTQEFNDFKTNDFETHIRNFDNPHRVTKEQIGLGNVPNVTPSNMTVTFSREARLENLVSGNTLSRLFGYVSKAVAELIEHLTTENPHEITPAKINASAVGHKHSAADITSGTLPVSRGGTGVTTLANLKTTVNRKVTYMAYTITAAGWTDVKTYSLEETYSKTKYHIEVSLAKTATIEQQKAFTRAKLAGDKDSNILTSLGRVPMIDIPVFLKLVEVI